MNEKISKLKLMLMIVRKTEKMARNVKAKRTDVKLKICVGEEPEPSTSRIVSEKTSQEESEIKVIMTVKRLMMQKIVVYVYHFGRRSC